MSKRAIYTGLLLVASQLASGCCCVRQSLWRWRCAPCGGGTCAPSSFSARVSMPPIASAPIGSAPVFHGGSVIQGGPVGGPDCVGCNGPVGGGYPVGGIPFGGSYMGGGMPMIGGPIPLGNGPMIERMNELPPPTPVNKGTN